MEEHILSPKEDETQHNQKVVRKRTYKKKHIVIVNSPNINEVTENITKLTINDSVPEKLVTFHSTSGTHMFQYSNKKTPFENACPWLLLRQIGK